MKTTRKIIFAALLASLTCVATMLIKIPSPLNGYLNLGDAVVLLSGFLLPMPYAFASAAIGSALADFFSPYAFYAPATFLIKGVEALLAYFVWTAIKKLIKNEKLDILPRAIAVITGELWMILGYFLFECILYGFGGATLSLFGNMLQGIGCGSCAIILIGTLYPIKAIKVLFPTLSK